MTWWLTLAVAVVALASLAWRWRRSSGRQRRLMLLCQRSGLDFAPLDLSPDTAWLPFPMFGRPKHGTENVVWDRQRGPEIRAFDFWFEDPTDGPRRRFSCAVVPLPDSAPRLRVSPRDLAVDAPDGPRERVVGIEALAHEGAMTSRRVQDLAYRLGRLGQESQEPRQRKPCASV